MSIGVSEFSDRIVLVTGGSRGIGAAIAQAFGNHGATVAVHGRDRTALAAVVKKIESGSGRAMAVTGDVTRWSDIEAIRQEVERALGPVDILVANAGGSPTPPGPLEELTEQGWRASVDGNLTATFLTLKSFLPGMKVVANHNPGFAPAMQPTLRTGTEAAVAATLAYLS